ncbi:MAG: hypothetical protein U9N82_10345 [Thermodesulfobacteriota bacterium]|nr:hypothetical protein [Thermodesulfobacteriota bacterium]
MLRNARPPAKQSEADGDEIKNTKSLREGERQWSVVRCRESGEREQGI